MHLNGIPHTGGHDVFVLLGRTPSVITFFIVIHKLMLRGGSFDMLGDGCDFIGGKES